MSATGFGVAAPDRKKNFSAKPSTSIFGGEAETGVVKFQGRGGQKHKNASVSPFGTA